MMLLQLFEDGVNLLLLEVVKSKFLKLQSGHLSSKLAQFELLNYKIVLTVYFAFYLCVLLMSCV